MSYRPTYVRGEWKALCDICGVEYKASQLQKRWDGFMVCSKDWEPRHPQDFVRGVADFQTPPYTRPETQDIFLSIGSNDCTNLVYYVDTAVTDASGCDRLIVDATLTILGTVTITGND